MPKESKAKRLYCQTEVASGERDYAATLKRTVFLLQDIENVTARELFVPVSTATPPALIINFHTKILISALCGLRPSQHQPKFSKPLF